MKLPEYLTPAQLQRLIKNGCTPMVRDAIAVMYNYGLRISELCNLDRSNVDLEHDVIRFYGKGNKERELPITEGTRAMIMQAITRPGKLYPFTVRTFRNYVYLAAEKAGLFHVHPHMIRHSTATHLMNAGAELADIKAYMRHECIASTMIYTHVATDRIRGIMDHVTQFNQGSSALVRL